VRDAIDRFVKIYNVDAAPFEWRKATVHNAKPTHSYAELRKWALAGPTWSSAGRRIVPGRYGDCWAARSERSEDVVSETPIEIRRERRVRRRDGTRVHGPYFPGDQIGFVRVGLTVDVAVSTAGVYSGDPAELEADVGALDAQEPPWSCSSSTDIVSENAAILRQGTATIRDGEECMETRIGDACAMIAMAPNSISRTTINEMPGGSAPPSVSRI